MELNEKNISLWSKLGSRATYGLAILELIKVIEDQLIVVTADTSTSAGLDRFKKRYPKNLPNSNFIKPYLKSLIISLFESDIPSFII